MTAVASSVFTAAQFNTFIRDNLSETAPAKATTPGSHFVTSDTNQIAERTPKIASDANSGTTTSTAFTDLDSPAVSGPSVSVVTGSAALIVISGSSSNSGTGASRIAYETSGASTTGAADTRGIGIAGATGATLVTCTAIHETSLNPGTNTFTLKYRVSAGTGTFSSRRISVIPF